MQAIVTKYHGPTDRHGARISAECDGVKVTIPYPHELSGADVHARAAREVCRRIGMTGRLVAAELAHGYVFVHTSNETFAI